MAPQRQSGALRAREKCSRAIGLGSSSVSFLELLLELSQPRVAEGSTATSGRGYASPNKFCVYYYAALAAPAHFFACTSRRFLSFLRWLLETGSPAASVSGRPLSSKVE